MIPIKEHDPNQRPLSLAAIQFTLHCKSGYKARNSINDRLLLGNRPLVCSKPFTIGSHRHA